MKKAMIIIGLFLYLCSIEEVINSDPLVQNERKPSIRLRNPQATLLALIQNDDLSDLALIEYLLDNGADIAHENYKPLMMAASLGRKDIVAMFVSRYPIAKEQKQRAYAEALNGNHQATAQLLAVNEVPHLP